MVWQGLDEPLILAACAGAGSAALSATRRFRRAKSRVAYGALCAAATESYLVGGAVSLIVLHLLPDDPRLSLALTIVAAWAWDWTADETRWQWRSIIQERIGEALRALTGGRNDK